MTHRSAPQVLAIAAVLLALPFSALGQEKAPEANKPVTPATTSSEAAR